MLIAWLLVGNFASAGAANDTKSKKLWALSKKLQTYIEKDINKNIVKLKNTQDKANYKSELSIISADLQKLSNTFAYWSDENYAEYVAQLRNEAKDYIKMKKELSAYLGGWASPFAVSSDEINKVESDILSIQKEVVSFIKEKMESYSWSSFKETWASKFEVATDFWKVSVSLERYTNIMALVTMSQEADFLIKFNFDLTVPWQSQYINNKVVAWAPVKVKWDLSFDINAKIIDKDVYLNLKDYSTVITTSLKDANFDAQLTEMKQALDSFKWKTVRIVIPEQENISQMNQAQAIESMKKMLDVINTNSLLTIYKKVDGWFALKIKTDTILKISEIYGKGTTKSEIEKGLQSMKNPVIYSSVGWTMTLTEEENFWAGTIKSVLTSKNGKYTFESVWKSPSSSDGAMTSYLYLERWIVKFNLKTNSQTTDIDYKDKNLTFDLKAGVVRINVVWMLSEEKTDLAIKYNDKNIGYVRSSKTWTKQDYDISLTFDIPANTLPAEMNSKTVKISFSWNVDLQTWNFTVEKPKSFIELDDIDIVKEQTVRARDAIRFGDIMTLQSGVEQYYQDEWEYPVKIDSVKAYINKMPKDPKDWQTINGCKFWYIYKVKNSSDGVNQNYSLSTCLESKDNQSRASGDDWTDPMRYEVGYE